MKTLWNSKIDTWASCWNSWEMTWKLFVTFDQLICGIEKSDGQMVTRRSFAYFSQHSHWIPSGIFWITLIGSRRDAVFAPARDHVSIKSNISRKGVLESSFVSDSHVQNGGQTIHEQLETVLQILVELVLVCFDEPTVQVQGVTTGRHKITTQNMTSQKSRFVLQVLTNM